MTQNITEETVAHVARLARISLSHEELAAMQEHFSRLLDMVDTIRSVDTDDVAPMSHPGDPVKALREDNPELQNHQDALMELAPDADDDHYRVPRVVGG